MSHTRRDFLAGSIAALGSFHIGFPLSAQVAQAQTLDKCPVDIPTPDQIPIVYSEYPSLIGLRAYSLLNQLNRGYEYFGVTRNWVPLQSFKSLSASNGSLLKRHMEIADVIRQQVCVTESLLKKQKTYDDAVKSGIDTQSLISKDNEQLLADAIRQSDKIDIFAKELSVQIGLINDWQKAFNDALSRTTPNNCGFGEILEIVGIVVAVVGAVYTGGMSLVAVYSSLESFATNPAVGNEALGLVARIKSDYDAAKPLVSKIEAVSADAKDIRDKYKSLQQTLAADPKSGKLVVDKDGWTQLSDQRIAEFDQQIDDVPGTSEEVKQAKKPFKDAVHKYYSLCQTYNQMIADHDSLVLQIRTNASKMLELALSCKKLVELKVNLQQSAQTTLKVQFVSTLTQIQRSQLSVLRKLVWEEKRAQAFMRVQPALLASDEMLQLNSMNDPVSLSQFNETLDVRHAEYSEELITNASLPFVSPTIFHIAVDAGTKKEFSDSKRLLFSIRPADAFYRTSWREIFLTHVKVSMKPNGDIFGGTLVNLGRHQFIDIEGRNVEFRSDNLLIPVSGGMQNSQSLIGAEDPSLQGAGVGGFGDWMLIADPDVPKSFFTELESIEFTFDGRNRAPARYKV